MRTTLLFVIYMLLFFGLPGCKNYIGNPHAKAVAPRIAATQASDLQLNPSSWQLDGRRREVQIQICRPGIEAYQVQLGAVDKVTLVKTEASEPGCLALTLALRKRTPAQKVPVFLTQGRRTMSGEWLLLPKPE